MLGIGEVVAYLLPVGKVSDSSMNLDVSFKVMQLKGGLAVP